MEFKEKQPLYLLAEIAEILRAEGGCAWDREQTSKTLRPYLIEEAYELYDAIESEDPEHIKEELGDCLYQAYAHAQIAKEQNQFTIDDVAMGIVTKLIRRHPHVFEDKEDKSASEVKIEWEKIKKTEKANRESILDGVPAHLPALLKAYRVQHKVADVGFDWEHIEDTVEKLDEEVGELKEAIALNDKENIIEEAGDILFSIVNVLRFIKVNPEEALRATIDKFVSRFKYIEEKVAAEEQDMNEMSLEELDELWEEAKNEKRTKL
ncbi:MAG: nucleoside triphosphate pyrophosphohydrolase [bacterium]|nr:nucleoside triphosphate pyrophosphohydrolase [bacterium]